jgi:hypothetical protein
MQFDSFIVEIESRLPELEWKLSSIGQFINKKQLPRGSFRLKLELTPEDCIKEIRDDLITLKNEKKPIVANHLANRIAAKINILVSICKLKDNKTLIYKSNVELKTISTRETFIKNIESNINKLELQKQALNSLAIDKSNNLAKLDLESINFQLKQLNDLLYNGKRTY